MDTHTGQSLSYIVKPDLLWPSMRHAVLSLWVTAGFLCDWGGEGMKGKNAVEDYKGPTERERNLSLNSTEWIPAIWNLDLFVPQIQIQ